MKLDSSNPPIYLADKEQTSVLRLGFEHCAADQWIHPPCDLNTFFRHKSALASSHGEQCHAHSPGSEETQREFHDFLLQRLLANTHLGYRSNGKLLLHEQEQLSWELNEQTLWQASLWVPEDICLLEKRDSDYTMTAASVCSPSNWILPEKIGQTIDFIHAPVPGYQDVLSQRVNRFLEGMRSDRIMLRYNWSIQQSNELFWRKDLDASLDACDAINLSTPNLYWRVERQTFIRLPHSGAIVFGIRIFLHSFASLQRTPGFNEAICRLIEQLPEAERRYKGIAI